MSVYEVTTDGGTYQIETDDAPEKSVGGFAANALKDIPETLGTPFKQAEEAGKNITQTGLEMAAAPFTGEKYAETPWAKQTADFQKNMGATAEGLVRPATHPIDYAYEHPIQQGLNVLGLGLGVKGLMSGKPPIPETGAGMPKPPSPAGLPIIEKGPMTGKPVALFDYNDPITGKASYKIYGDPELTGIKTTGNVPLEDLKAKGIEVVGQTPKAAQLGQAPIEPPVVPMGEAEPKFTGASQVPPDPNAPKPPPPPTPKADPLKQFHDYMKQKYEKVGSDPGIWNKAAKLLEAEAHQLRGKDIGLQPRQIMSMGKGFKGLEKAEKLMDYADQQGYFDPSLSDVSRKAAIKARLADSGQQTDAIRSLGNARGTPPLAEMRTALKTELTNQFGIDAPNEIKKVLAKFDKAAKDNPTFSGMADLATELNKAKTPMQSLGQHPGPTTEAANIVSRMNNQALRALLNPQENAVYTKVLRDYGAHRKLEQAVAASGRRGMSARSNQRGILGRLWQEALDRGGYRIAGNVADRMAKWKLANPTKANTLPEFFEELAHHTDDVLDEALDIQNPNMAHGGIVPELNDFLSKKYGKKGELQNAQVTR